MEYKAKKAYKDKHIVESYNDKRFNNFKGKITNWLELRLIDKALYHARVLPPVRILDIPCGTGRLSLHLLHKGYLVTGADISSEMVSYTNERLKENGFTDKTTARIENAEDLSFPDNSFDGGVCLRLLGHIPPENRIKIVRELNRVCRNFLILAFYHKRSLQSILRKQGRKQRDIPWYPVDIPEIDQQLKKLGLKKDRVFYLARGLSETMVVLIRK